MGEATIYSYKTILVEKAISDKGDYAIITKDARLREEIWRSLCRMMKGSVKHATQDIATINLNNKSKVVVLVHPTKGVPRWLGFDGVWFDGSHDG